MIRVASLHVYPVKSCRGIDLDEAEVVSTGLRWDRKWVVVGADGAFLSQRTHPVMATVSTDLVGGWLRIGDRVSNRDRA